MLFFFFVLFFYVGCQWIVRLAKHPRMKKQIKQLAPDQSSLHFGNMKETWKQKCVVIKWGRPLKKFTPCFDSFFLKEPALVRSRSNDCSEQIKRRLEQINKSEREKKQWSERKHWKEVRWKEDWAASSCRFEGKSNMTSRPSAARSYVLSIPADTVAALLRRRLSEAITRNYKTGFSFRSFGRQHSRWCISFTPFFLRSLLFEFYRILPFLLRGGNSLVHLVICIVTFVTRPLLDVFCRHSF